MSWRKRRREASRRASEEVRRAKAWRQWTETRRRIPADATELAIDKDSVEVAEKKKMRKRWKFVEEWPVKR